MLEREMILRAQDGDREAAEALIVRHWPQVYRMLYARLGNRAEAEDLTQECFTRLWRALPGFRGDDIGPFARTIALNLLRNLIRDRARHPSLEIAETDADVPSAEHEALERYRQEEIRSMLHRLSDDHRTVLDLRLIQALSVSEVSERMGRGQEAVRSLQYRAIQELRAQIKASADAGEGVR